MKLPNTNSVATVMPIIVLGIGMILLITAKNPSPNHDLVLTIVSGILGYLAKGDHPPPPGGVA